MKQHSLPNLPICPSTCLPHSPKSPSSSPLLVSFSSQFGGSGFQCLGFVIVKVCESPRIPAEVSHWQLNAVSFWSDNDFVSISGDRPAVVKESGGDGLGWVAMGWNGMDGMLTNPFGLNRLVFPNRSQPRAFLVIQSSRRPAPPGPFQERLLRQKGVGPGALPA